MRTTIGQASKAGLEGLCEPAISGNTVTRPWICIGGGAGGIERLAAYFPGPAFSPHRHDTYAIGITLKGVQTFQYRGERRCCLPGEGHVLHPDELHDGSSGTGEGFGYKILYIDPTLVQQALGGRPLPFVANPIFKRPELLMELQGWLAGIERPIDGCQSVEIAVSVSDMLEALSSPSRRPQPLCLEALGRIRELIAADPAILHPAAEFERVSGLDRWTLARQFRAAFGTSPSRFRTMRQLDRARFLMCRGTPLARAALEAGFSDQSHMSRMFKRTYGLTPARWIAGQRLSHTHCLIT
jgi:AraC-like DNA-binding protein